MLNFVVLNAQVNIFTDSFENCTDFSIASTCSWTFRDIDQSADVHNIMEARFTNNPGQVQGQDTRRSFIVFNWFQAQASPGFQNMQAFQAQDGLKCMANFGNYGNENNNDWLISPRIQLGSTGNRVSFWTKEVSVGGPAQNSSFTVGISTTGTQTNNFTIITANPIQTVANSVHSGSNVWVEHNIDIPQNYNNQNVYISINVTRSTYFLLIDNFRVSRNNALSINEFNDANNIEVFPNPSSERLYIKDVNKLGDNVEYSIIDCSGRIVKYGNIKSEEQIEISALNNGIYMFQLKAESGTITKKIIKK